MDVRTLRLLLTLVAAVSIAVLTSGCGDTILGPADVPVATPKAALADLVPAEIIMQAVVIAGTDPYHAAWPTKHRLAITGAAGRQIVVEVVTPGDPGVADPLDRRGGNNKFEFHHE